MGIGSDAKSVWMESWAAMKTVMKVRTFQIIILQGVVGMLPWTAMVFFTMWFELIGELLSVQCAYIPCFLILGVLESSSGESHLQVTYWRRNLVGA